MTALRVSLVQPALPRYRLALFRELASRPEIDLHVWYGRQPGLTNAEPQGFNATPHPQRLFAGQRFYWQGRHLSAASRRQSDVLIASWNTRDLSLLPALAKARLEGVGTVLWGHGYSKREGALRLALRTKLGLRADANLFYDARTRSRFIQRNGSPSRLFVARNAIDQQEIQASRNHFLNHPAELETFRTSQGLNKKKLLLFVARLTPERQFEVLLHALKQLGDDAVVLAAIGGGAHQDKMMCLAKELGIDSQCRWLPAIYQGQQLAPWFMSAHAMCFPSEIGLSIQHAFGYALPVIIGDDLARHGPEVEAFEENRNGLSFTHDSPKALSGVLRNYFEHPELRTRLSAGALGTAEEYSLSSTVDGFIGAIHYAHDRARA